MKQPNRSRGFTLVELLVVIGIIALLISILLPSLNRARETANRVKCAANLKAIGNSLLLYSNDNKSAYPRTIYKEGTYPLVPTWGTGAASTNPFSSGPAGSARPYDNDITAAIYLLLSTQDITGDSFVCPSASQEKWDFGGGSNTASNWSNWNGSTEITKRLGYSYQNPYPDTPATSAGFRLNSAIGADFAVFADINPGTMIVYDGLGGPSTSDNVIEPTSAMSGSQRSANSNNHDKVGQNVLYGDGHVDWSLNAFAGSAGDNIYTRKKSATDQNISDPTHPYCGSLNASDNCLLPTD